MLMWIAAALAWTPTDAESAMIRAFSARDGSPPCADVEALAPEPIPALEALIANVTMPPWVPMHAAACLVERHAEARPELLASWVVDPARKGLARLLFRRLHLVEPVLADDLARKGLGGPLQAEARRALTESPRAELRDLAAGEAPR